MRLRAAHGGMSKPGGAPGAPRESRGSAGRISAGWQVTASGIRAMPRGPGYLPSQARPENYSMFCTCSGRSAGKAHGCWVSRFRLSGGYTCGYTGIGGWSCVVVEQRSNGAHLPPTGDFGPGPVTSDAARKVDVLRSNRSVQPSSQLISPRGSRDGRQHRPSASCEGSNARVRTLVEKESLESARTFHARGFDPTPGCR